MTRRSLCAGSRLGSPTPPPAPTPLNAEPTFESGFAEGRGCPLEKRRAVSHVLYPRLCTKGPMTLPRVFLCLSLDGCGAHCPWGAECIPTLSDLLRYNSLFQSTQLSGFYYVLRAMQSSQLQSLFTRKHPHTCWLSVLSLEICTFLAFHVNGIMYHAAVCVGASTWHTVFRAHVGAWINTSFLCIAK